MYHAFILIFNTMNRLIVITHLGIWFVLLMTHRVRIARSVFSNRINSSNFFADCTQFLLQELTNAPSNIGSGKLSNDISASCICGCANRSIAILWISQITNSAMILWPTSVGCWWSKLIILSNEKFAWWMCILRRYVAVRRDNVGTS